LLSNIENVLVLSPHTDDGELGAGGTICKLGEMGAKIHYVAFSTAEESVPDHLPRDILKTEVRNATKLLNILPENLHILDYKVRNLNYRRQDILEYMISLRSGIKFDLVFTPSLNDVHQDHEAVSREALRAFKNTKILSYELIWNNLNFNTSCFFGLEERHVRQKALALEEYKSQSHRKYMSSEFVFSLAQTRGVQISRPYAEAFEVVRWIVS